MSLSQDQILAAQDLFAGLGDITTRRMMGGLCLYHRGTIFAVLRSDDVLLLKGKGAFVDELEAAGCTQWTEDRDGKAPGRMPYWNLPEAARDDHELACDWARRALAHL